jgi:mannose-P-dolichol utilization defect protein 1
MQPLRIVALGLAWCCATLVIVDARRRGPQPGDEDLILGVISPKCYALLVEDKLLKFDIPTTMAEIGVIKPCVKAVISKGLGYAITFGSGILKVPQIYNIVSAGDATGLAATSFYVEVVDYLGISIYNYRQDYPFSTYGENVVILAQSILLVLLLWQYSAKPYSMMHKLFVVASGGAVVFAAFSLPSKYLPLLPTFSICCAVIGKFPQIATNVSQGHTGRLSFLTNFLQTGGNGARIYTTLQETSDVYVLLKYVLACFLTGTMAIQCVLYRWQTREALAKLHKKKE